jgi:acetylornithine deacetylase/succinyl-diaminopimelate desuccinylase-like protein
VAVILLPSSIVTVMSEGQTQGEGRSRGDRIADAVARDPAELLADLIRFDTSNPPGNERACLEFVAQVLEERGVVSQFLFRDPERPNLVARLAGRGQAPPLLLYGHVDVVPARPGEWLHPPFAGELVEGDVWGRGALDMKGGAAMLISALLRIAADDEPPLGDVVLTLTSDEERGSELGAKFLVDEHPDVFTGVRYAFSEIGGFTEWVGDRRLYPIQVSEKQRCLVRATVRGIGGHPSTVVRGTATAKLGRLLSRLDKKRLPVHVTPQASRMIRAMAGGLPAYQRFALHALLRQGVTDQLLNLLGSQALPLDALLHNTATPTVVRGGESTNVIPTEVSVDLDGRVLPGQTPIDLVRELEDLAGDLAEFELVSQEPAGGAEADLTLYPMLAEIIATADPGGAPIPALIPGYTDARYFARLGIQTYGFLPMRLPKEITVDLIHAPNERVPADAIRFGTECLVEAVRRYGVLDRGSPVIP